MSSESYRKWWVLTKKQLEQLQDYDAFIRSHSQPEKSRVLANHLVSGLYTKYCMVVKNIDVCLDQIYQPQKRITIRKLMDSATMRLNELNNSLRDIDLSEIHYVDGTLIEQKLVPHSIEIISPALFFPRPFEIQDMVERIEKGERIFTPSPTLTPSASKTSKGDDDGVKTDETQTKDAEGEKKEGEGEKKEGEGDKKEGEGEKKDGEGEKKEGEGEKKEGEGDKKDGEKKGEEKKGDGKEGKSKEQIKEEKKKRKASVKKLIFEKKELSPEELEALHKKEIITNAVLVIQNAERARQARLYCMDIVGSRGGDSPEKSPSKTKKLKPIDPEDLEKAATGFQKLYRGHLVREEQKRRELKRRYLIGMYIPSWRNMEQFEKLKRNAEIRRQIVRQKIKEYVDAIDAEKDRLLRVVAPGLMEDIGEEIRQWFYDWYMEIQCFDKIPPASKGGTVLVIRCETFTPQEYLADLEAKKKEKADPKAAAEKAAKAKKKKEEEKKKKEALKKKLAAEKKAKAKGEFEFEFPKDEDAPAMSQMGTAFSEYFQLWNEKKMIDNPTDQLYMDLITEEKCYEIQLDVREQVDVLMRAELKLLNQARIADLAKAGKKAKMPKEKKDKKKKAKVDKKDLTRNRRTEDIFQELVDNGIIRKYPVVHLEDFKGDFSYVNWDQREEECDTLPCLGDVRQAVALSCILPLGVQAMVKPKSVLLAGPKKCGKHLLANAIFNETKAVLFDISAEVVAGKYPDKTGLKMLLHLLTKMSRLLQPSIIFVDGAERMFYKSVPKNEKDLDPKRLGSQLVKGIIKPIQKEDRVLVLGITNQPWAASPKGLKKGYERTILIPRTDYGSAYLFWQEYLMRYHGVDRMLDLSILAKLSVNYPPCVIKQVVESVLTPRRIVELSYQPLQEFELYDALISNPDGPIPDKDFQKLMKFYKKTSIGAARAKYQVIIDKVKEAEKAAAEKAAEKAAKKK